MAPSCQRQDFAGVTFSQQVSNEKQGSWAVNKMRRTMTMDSVT
jgi:hypothetical protein